MTSPSYSFNTYKKFHLHNHHNIRHNIHHHHTDSNLHILYNEITHSHITHPLHQYLDPVPLFYDPDVFQSKSNHSKNQTSQYPLVESISLLLCFYKYCCLYYDIIIYYSLYFCNISFIIDTIYFACEGIFYIHFFRLMIQRVSTIITMLISATPRYPYFQDSSGIFAKFIPYHPTKRVSGRKIVVTTVSIFITLF